MGVVLGIDPGTKGAIAVLNGESASVHRMPETYPEIVQLLKPYAGSPVAIERVHSFPGQGVSSTFSFGESFGVLQGIAHALGCSVALILPRQWKADYPVLQGLDKKAAKARARSLAAELFPALADEFRLVKDADKAEALLIALSHRQRLQRNSPLVD